MGLQITKVMKKNPLLNTSFFTVVLLMVSACSGEAPPAMINYPEEGSPAMQLYIGRCGDCHVAPEPVSRTAKVWPGILHRMQMRMQANARKPLDKTEMSLILDYLQRHARVETTQ